MAYLMKVKIRCFYEILGTLYRLADTRIEKLMSFGFAHRQGIDYGKKRDLLVVLKSSQTCL